MFCDIFKNAILYSHLDFNGYIHIGTVKAATTSKFYNISDVERIFMDENNNVRYRI